MDCTNKTYHFNAYGFAKRCACHQAVHINFGNVSLLLSHPQILDFSRYISSVLFTEAGVPDRDERNIYLPTFDAALMFAMSYHEIMALHEILEQTLLMLEVEAALNDQ